jgi:hypothetical protein
VAAAALAALSAPAPLIRTRWPARTEEEASACPTLPAPMIAMSM